MARQPIEEIERRLHQLGVPDDIITKHCDALRKTRRVLRKKLVLVLEGNHLRYRCVTVEPAEIR